MQEFAVCFKLPPVHYEQTGTNQVMHQPLYPTASLAQSRWWCQTREMNRLNQPPLVFGLKSSEACLPIMILILCQVYRLDSKISVLWAPFLLPFQYTLISHLLLHQGTFFFFPVHVTEPGAFSLAHKARKSIWFRTNWTQLSATFRCYTVLCVFHQSTHDNGFACFENVSWPGSPAFSITGRWLKTRILSLFASFWFPLQVPEELPCWKWPALIYPYKSSAAKVTRCPAPHHKLFFGAVPITLAKLLCQEGRRLCQEVWVLDCAICHFDAEVTAGATSCSLLLTFNIRWPHSMPGYYPEGKKNAFQPKISTYRTWSYA